MSTINRLSSVDALQPGDLIPVWDGSNGDTRKASLTTLLAFIESNFADPDYSTRIVAPAVDYFNVDIGATGDSIWMIINPTLNFTNGAVTLPPTSSAVNDQEITMVFTASVSTFVITSAGATVLGAPAQINGYDSFRVRYNAAQQTWYNIGTTGSGSGSGVSQIVRQDFTGDGTTTTFALLNIPSALGNELQIFIDGVYQERAGYTVSGVNIIFSEAPPALSNIEVLGWSVSIGAETSANLVSYTPAGTGAVLTTVQAKLRESVSVKDFGAVGDGVTDDTAAIQAALDACPEFSSVYIGGGTFVVSAGLVINTDNITIYGNGVIKAADSINFSPVLNGANRTGVTVDGLTVDANKAGRLAGQTMGFSAIGFNTTVDCTIQNCTVKNSLGPPGGGSTVALYASGGALRFRVLNVNLLDCGDTAINLPSDGIFIRGDECLIDNCHAYRVTDTAFVLEGCNYSRVSNCTVYQSTAFAAISNDTADDCAGNSIDGITGSCKYVGSTGGIIAVACFGAGNIRQSTISNVTIRLDAAATGLGPGVQLRTVSTGNVLGMVLSNISIDTNGTSAKLAQGFFISDSVDVQIVDPYIKMDASLGSSAIYFELACTGIVNGGYIETADYGINVQDSSVVTAQNVVLSAQGTYGLFATDTATIKSNSNTITGAGTAATAVTGSAVITTLPIPPWVAWTPVYSSDLGDAATTFSGAVTTTLAKYIKIGNSCTVVVNINGTLNAVTPQTIRLTLPAGIVSANTNTYTPAIILNDVTYETGLVRAVTDKLFFYRANISNYSSSAAVSGQVSFTFEIL